MLWFDLNSSNERIACTSHVGEVWSRVCNDRCHEEGIKNIMLSLCLLFSEYYDCEIELKI